MKQIALVQFVRMGSKRLPCKPILELGGEPLICRTLRLFNGITSQYDSVHPIVIFPEEDYLIRNHCDKAGVEYYMIKPQQGGRIWPELIQPFMFYLQEYDVVCDINWMCHPFIEWSTINRFIEAADQIPFSWTATIERRNTLWGEDRNCIHGRGELADTSLNPVYLEPAHMIYAWQRYELKLEESSLASKVLPVPFAFQPHELIDIDTESDLALARRYYRP